MSESPAMLMQEITDAELLSAAKVQREQFERNAVWLQNHVSEVYSACRGKCICIAGEQLFVADTVSDVVAQAMAVHPHDKGRLVQYIPRERVPRIYAN